MTFRLSASLAALAASTLFTLNAAVADTNTRVALAPTQDTGAAPQKTGAGPSAASAYVFSAPPRESVQAANEIYKPIAEYLTRITGKPVTYKHPANWIAYQTEMRKGEYDLVFDGPHFNGWRAVNLQHNVLVKTGGEHSFVVAVKKSNERIQDMKQLAGRAVCGMSPPNLGTLTVLKEFDNPVRQPVIQNTESWEAIYLDMQAGRCTAAILPTRHHAKFDAQGENTRVIFRARTFPNQALSAGPRVAAEDQIKIVRAMTAPEARPALAKLREANALTGDFVPANKSEYVGMAKILSDTWGYQ